MNFYQVDAFTNEMFKGNPAGVCPLNSWLSEEKMQAIAKENNLSETAFFVKNNQQFDIRWFTPSSEIDLCGHATLATAHILFTELGFEANKIMFNSKSGTLTVEKKDNWYTLNFPSEKIEEIEIPEILKKAFNVPILKCYKGKWKCLVELKDETAITALTPNFNLLKQLEFYGVIVTSKGDSSDFVSRFFAPKIGINEDPVTGSAHTLLIPFWANKLNKQNLTAYQLSERIGFLKCQNFEERVEMSGQAITYLKGQININ